MFVLGVPFLIFAIVIVARLKRYITHPYVIKLYVVGFLVFVGSAGGIEILANFTQEPGWNIYFLQVAAEEFGEMVGVTLLFWATYEIALDYGITIQAHAKTRPPASIEVPVESNVGDVNGR